MFRIIARTNVVALCVLPLAGCADAPPTAQQPRTPLRVELSSPKHTYMLFEPVVVTLRVTNSSGVTKLVRVADEMNSVGEIWLCTPDGRRVTPRACELVSGIGPMRAALKPGATIEGTWLLHYSFGGRGGFLFGEPGQYQIHGRFRDESTEDREGIDIPADSAPLTVNLTEPAAGKKPACDLFRTKEVAGFLLGCSADDESLRRCRELIKDHAQCNYAQYARYAIANHLQRQAVSTANIDEKVRLLDESLELFQTLLNESPDFPLVPAARYAIAKAHYLKGRDALRHLSSSVEWLGALRAYRDGFAVDNP